MRLARNLLLAATAAIAAMAFMATSAFGQSIEVESEPTGLHCGDVTESAGHVVGGGCQVHANSEDNAQTFQHTGTSEVVTTSCQNEFTAHISEDATGYIAVNDQTVFGPVPPCVITACDEAEGVPGQPHPEYEWPISGMFEYGPGREAMVMTFCIRAINQPEGGGNSSCTVIVDATQNLDTHQIEFTAFEEPCFEDPTRELSGHWLTEALPVGNEVNVELHHIHYPGS
jgi:hypothetical protein